MTEAEHRKLHYEGLLDFTSFSTIQTNCLRRLKWTEYAARTVGISGYEKYTEASESTLLHTALLTYSQKTVKEFLIHPA